MKSKSQQVAELAGVSVSSVYQIMANPDNTRFGQDTRDKVIMASRRVGFVPQAAAKALRSRHTQTIGLLLCEESLQEGQLGGFQAKFLPAFSVEAAHRGYYTLIKVLTEENSDDSIDALNHMILSKRCDGIISLYGSPRENRLLGTLHKHPEFPCIFIGNPAVEFGSVDNNNSDVSQKAVSHLIELGHQNILHVTGPEDDPLFADRRNGYRKTMLAAGLVPVEEELLGPLFTAKEPWEQWARRIWLKDNYPTAVFIDDDLRAVLLMEALRKIGITVPGDVSIVGVNDDAICQQVKPMLTSVRINIEELVRQAVELIISKIQSTALPFCRHLVGTELIVRDSTTKCKKIQN